MGGEDSELLGGIGAQVGFCALDARVAELQRYLADVAGCRQSPPTSDRKTMAGCAQDGVKFRPAEKWQSQRPPASA